MLQEEDNTINEFFDNPNEMDKPLKVENSYKNLIYFVLGSTMLMILLLSV